MQDTVWSIVALTARLEFTKQIANRRHAGKTLFGHHPARRQEQLRSPSHASPRDPDGPLAVAVLSVAVLMVVMGMVILRSVAAVSVVVLVLVAGVSVLVLVLVLVVAVLSVLMAVAVGHVFDLAAHLADKSRIAHEPRISVRRRVGTYEVGLFEPWTGVGACLPQRLRGKT